MAEPLMIDPGDAGAIRRMIARLLELQPRRWLCESEIIRTAVSDFLRKMEAEAEADWLPGLAEKLVQEQTDN